MLLHSALPALGISVVAAPVHRLQDLVGPVLEPGQQVGHTCIDLPGLLLCILSKHIVKVNTAAVLSMQDQSTCPEAPYQADRSSSANVTRSAALPGEIG
jgi:hypothetical protein